MLYILYTNVIYLKNNKLFFKTNFYLKKEIKASFVLVPFVKKSLYPNIKLIKELRKVLLMMNMINKRKTTFFLMKQILFR